MSESGFESGNTISFEEDKKEKGLTGMARLIQLSKKPLVNGIHFKILQKKVLSEMNLVTHLNNKPFRTKCLEVQGWMVSIPVVLYGFRRKP